MSWSFIAATDLGNAHTGSRTVTVGNLLIMLYINGALGDVPVVSSDTGGNTWTKIVATLSDASNNNSLTWWWAPAVGNPNVTIGSITGGDEGMAILEWNSTAGAVPSDALETSARNVANFTNGSGSTATDGDTGGTVSAPASNGDLLVSFIVDTQAGSATFTQGTGFAKRFTGVSGNPITVEDFSQATAASKATTWTASATNAYGASGAFFKEASGAATTWGPLLALKNNQLVGP